MQYPVLRTAHSTLLPQQTCSIRHYLNLSGKHPVLRTAQHFTSPTDLFNQTLSQLITEASSHAAINARRLLTQISTTVRYSFIQLSELERCRVKKLAQGFTQNHRIRTWILLVESPKLYPWSTALYIRDRSESSHHTETVIILAIFSYYMFVYFFNG